MEGGGGLRVEGGKGGVHLWGGGCKISFARGCLYSSLEIV